MLVSPPQLIPPRQSSSSHPMPWRSRMEIWWDLYPTCWNLFDIHCNKGIYVKHSIDGIFNGIEIWIDAKHYNIYTAIFKIFQNHRISMDLRFTAFFGLSYDLFVCELKNAQQFSPWYAKLQQLCISTIGLEENMQNISTHTKTIPHSWADSEQK